MTLRLPFPRLLDGKIESRFWREKITLKNWEMFSRAFHYRFWWPAKSAFCCIERRTQMQFLMIRCSRFSLSFCLTKERAFLHSSDRFSRQNQSSEFKFTQCADNIEGHFYQSQMWILVSTLQSQVSSLLSSLMRVSAQRLWKTTHLDFFTDEAESEAERSSFLTWSRCQQRYQYQDWTSGHHQKPMMCTVENDINLLSVWTKLTTLGIELHSGADFLLAK